jgi:uncharacterized protein
MNKKEDNMEAKQITIQQEKTSDHKYIQVKSSGIHRHGVFAKKDIPKGTRIIEYIGIRISKEESKKIQDESIKAYEDDPENNAATYIFEIDEKHDLQGDIPNNDAKYINHSCNPNCEVDIIDGRIWIDAIKDIKNGEEITYNYGFEIDKNDNTEFKKHPCLCGSKNCVGYILAEDEWSKLKEIQKKETMAMLNHKVLKHN